MARIFRHPCLSHKKYNETGDSKISVFQTHLVFSAINLKERNIALSVDLISRRVAVQTFGLKNSECTCCICLPTNKITQQRFSCDMFLWYWSHIPLSFQSRCMHTCTHTHTHTHTNILSLSLLLLLFICYSVSMSLSEKASYLRDAFPGTCYF